MRRTQLSHSRYQIKRRQRKPRKRRNSHRAQNTPHQIGNRASRKPTNLHSVITRNTKSSNKTTRNESSSTLPNLPKSPCLAHPRSMLPRLHSTSKWDTTTIQSTHHNHLPRIRNKLAPLKRLQKVPPPNLKDQLQRQHNQHTSKCLHPSHILITRICILATRPTHKAIPTQYPIFHKDQGCHIPWEE
ncbi:hypothetical protein MVEG_01058 [Podila verticillata NRRL 6337]|nr:hypothetical protein MVEG_01058 [Podila verticillata NRRL 6337]